MTLLSQNNRSKGGSQIVEITEHSHNRRQTEKEKEVKKLIYLNTFTGVKMQHA